MDPIDLYSPTLHDDLTGLIGISPGVTVRTVDGRHLTGPVVSVDSDPGRSVTFTINTPTGPERLDAAVCLSLQRTTGLPG